MEWLIIYGISVAALAVAWALPNAYHHFQYGYIQFEGKTKQLVLLFLVPVIQVGLFYLIANAMGVAPFRTILIIYALASGGIYFLAHFQSKIDDWQIYALAIIDVVLAMAGILKLQGGL